ncbi:hypothetical protein C9374_005268 [Naegleria lovaniensis]|uniref:Uncharacterized protein n=1 Tax=Naegleria lovaniensis TaxID=51637 RepID=A0AA88GQI5_NAELO|nr:uncharacterized protein C9374_005268 [Naegleria lovaniensis]KAG2382688.1 hypothetical protein C9374_005268 [Naegleria lovaniensis]
MMNKTPRTFSKENIIRIISKTDIIPEDLFEIMGEINEKVLTQTPRIPKTKPNMMILSTQDHDYEETLNSLFKYGISTGTFIASPGTLQPGEGLFKVEYKSPNKTNVQEKIGILIHILRTHAVSSIYANLYVSNDTFSLLVGHTDKNVITTIVNSSQGVFVEIPKPFISKNSEEYYKSGVCYFPEATSPNDIKEAVKKSLENSPVNFDENKLIITKLKSSYSSGGYYYKVIYICNNQVELTQLCQKWVPLMIKNSPASNYQIIKKFKPLAEQRDSTTSFKRLQGDSERLGPVKELEMKLAQHDQKIREMKTTMDSIQKDIDEMKQVLSKLPETIHQSVSSYDRFMRIRPTGQLFFLP